MSQKLSENNHPRQCIKSQSLVAHKPLSQKQCIYKQKKSLSHFTSNHFFGSLTEQCGFYKQEDLQPGK